MALMLRNNGIDFAGFCESKSYFREGRRILDKPVYLYDDLLMNTQKRNMVIGASGKNINDVIACEDRKSVV